MLARRYKGEITGGYDAGLGYRGPVGEGLASVRQHNPTAGTRLRAQLIVAEQAVLVAMPGAPARPFDQATTQNPQAVRWAQVAGRAGQALIGGAVAPAVNGL